MANWYTADPHFGHEAIIGLCNRPFHNANRMGTVLLTVNRHPCLDAPGDARIFPTR